MQRLCSVEHTSSAQQQAVTTSVNVDANPGTSSDVPKSLHGASPSFSGNFNNCTINISLP